MSRTPSVEEVLKKTSGSKVKKKGAPKPKRTPCWSRYKSENRAYHHQVKRVTKHVERNPNDKRSVSYLGLLKERRHERQ